jgi:hypothetical protein
VIPAAHSEDEDEEGPAISESEESSGTDSDDEPVPASVKEVPVHGTFSFFLRVFACL